MRPIFAPIYILLFIFSCYNFVYVVIISDEMPLQITWSEFIRAEASIVLIFSVHAFLLFKGNKIINLVVLLIPNILWFLLFLQAIRYPYHPYSTTLSTSMITGMAIILAANSVALFLSKRKAARLSSQPAHDYFKL
jgi:hypothetical protein